MSEVLELARASQLPNPRREAACSCSHTLGRHERQSADARGLVAYGRCLEANCSCKHWIFQAFRSIAPAAAKEA